MRQYLLLILALISFSNLLSQNFNSSGARAQSLAYSTGASISLWNISNNPSTTAFIENTTIGIDAKNDFMIKELSTATLVLLLPFNTYGNYGFSLQHFGYSSFNETKLAISFSKRLTNSTSASLQLSDNIQKINSDEFKSTEHEIGINIGMFTKLNSKIHLASYYNFQKNINDDSISNIQELALAISWFPISDLNVLMEVSKQTNTNISLKGGIEYKIVNRLFVRLGMSSEPYSVTIGLGLVFENLNIDVSFANNQYLGASSGISGNYIFRNN